MIVSPASRMLSAISFGVFWRLAPSTSAIIRSRKLSPGFGVTRTTISSDSTRVPPVTAERSPPDSRITGADSPVIADSSTLAMPSIDLAVAGDHLAGRDDARGRRRASCELGTSSIVAVGQPPAGDRLGARLAQRVGLRLAAALGHRLGEVREQHGEPQPGGDAAGEHVRLGGRVAEVLEEEDRRERGADLDHEHDRVARHAARVELAERCRAPPARRSPGSNSATEAAWCAHRVRCSTIGAEARRRGSR